MGLIIDLSRNFDLGESKNKIPIIFTVCHKEHECVTKSMPSGGDKGQGKQNPLSSSPCKFTLYSPFRI